MKIEIEVTIKGLDDILARLAGLVPPGGGEVNQSLSAAPGPDNNPERNGRGGGRNRPAAAKAKTPAVKTASPTAKSAAPAIADPVMDTLWQYCRQPEIDLHPKVLARYFREALAVGADGDGETQPNADKHYKGFGEMWRIVQRGKRAPTMEQLYDAITTALSPRELREVA